MECLNKRDNFVPQMFFTDTTSDFINSYHVAKNVTSEETQKGHGLIYPHDDTNLSNLPSAHSNAPIIYYSDLFEDPVMSDVTYFGNDVPLGRLGINKCIEKCKNGNCVEYGVTGHAHCFPPK